jgi:hypothetical protein
LQYNLPIFEKILILKLRMKNPLIIAFFFYFTFSYSQITFEKGFFISNDGTKTECFIKNIDWKNNPTEFKYKIQINDTQSLIQTIMTVQEFGINNVSRYKRLNVKIDQSSDNPNNLSTKENPIWKEEILFLKLLIEGDATLYSFSRENQTRYFYETKNTSLEQLIYKKYLSYDENVGADNIMVNNQYRQQLYNNVKCDNISERDMQEVAYKKSALIKYFSTYNSCGTNSVVNYENKVTENQFILKITSGIDLASLSISDPNPYNNKSTEMDTKAIFKIGIEGEYILPYNKNKWSLFINPTYQKYEAENTFVKNNGFGAIGKDITYHLKANYNSIEVPIGIRHYLFLNETSKIFINIAYVFGVLGKTTLEYSDNTSVESLSRNNLAVGFGYNLKKRYSAEVRFNAPRQILSDYISWSAKYSTIGILFGYRIL